MFQSKVLSKIPVAFDGSASGLERFFNLEHWCVTAEIGGAIREDDRVVWRRGAFVLVVAITPKGKVVVIREYKQAAEATFLGLPAGAVKKGETPLEAALRELTEETGYVGDPRSCFVLGPFVNSPDKSTETHSVVLVQNAKKTGAANPEIGESILAVELASVREVLADPLFGIALHRFALREASALLS